MLKKLLACTLILSASDGFATQIKDMEGLDSENMKIEELYNEVNELQSNIINNGFDQKSYKKYSSCREEHFENVMLLRAHVAGMLPSSLDKNFIKKAKEISKIIDHIKQIYLKKSLLIDYFLDIILIFLLVKADGF